MLGVEDVSSQYIDLQVESWYASLKQTSWPSTLGDSIWDIQDTTSIFDYINLEYHCLLLGGACLRPSLQNDSDLKIVQVLHINWKCCSCHSFHILNSAYISNIVFPQIDPGAIFSESGSDREVKARIELRIYHNYLLLAAKHLLKMEFPVFQPKLDLIVISRIDYGKNETVLWLKRWLLLRWWCVIIIRPCTRVFSRTSPSIHCLTFHDDSLFSTF